MQYSLIPGQQKAMKQLSIINGPNLNMLGTREPHIYGTKTLADIERELTNAFVKNAKFSFFQSNHEGELIDFIQSLSGCQGIIINPAAFTHTSVALRDALLGKNLPVIEVHLSNIYRREDFRKHSYVSDISLGVISGLGHLGYNLAVQALLAHLQTE